MKWTVATPPTREPLTLDEVRTHLREPEAAENPYISALLTAARTHVETICERALMPQVWRRSLDAFPEGYGGDLAIVLPGGQVREIVSITYTDASGTAQTLAPGSWQLDDQMEPAVLMPAPGAIWPQTQDEKINAVQITYAVGYADSSKVPAPLKSAMLLLLSDLFENREGSIIGVSREDNPAVMALLWPYRLRLLA